MGYIVNNIYNIPKEIIRSLMTNYPPQSMNNQSTAPIENYKIRPKKVNGTNVNAKNVTNNRNHKEEIKKKSKSLNNRKLTNLRKNKMEKILYN